MKNFLKIINTHKEIIRIHYDQMNGNNSNNNNNNNSNNTIKKHNCNCKINCSMKGLCDSENVVHQGIIFPKRKKTKKKKHKKLILEFHRLDGN